MLTGLERPTSLTHSGDGSGRLFVTEQTGRVRIIKDGQLLEQPLLDISGKITRLDPICCDERGLLSVAFPPNFSESGRFYAYYTGDNNTIYISRFHISEESPDVANPESEEVLVQIEHQFENHFGGQLSFGPIDHKLYFSIGDGAGGGNPLRSAQDPDSPFGKIWRFDAEGGSTDLELYSLGLRNPWRFSFDRLTGDLYIGDVGEDTWEEVNFQPNGTTLANFGWSVFEGPECREEADCGLEGITAPAISYRHDSGGCSVSGGYVYHGGESALLQGTYLYADFCYGKIWGASRPTATTVDSQRSKRRRRDEGEWQTQLLFEDNGRNWSALGEDEEGGIYAIDYLPGAVYRVNIAVEHAAEETVN